MVRQKQMCAVARPVGVGIALSQALLLALGVSYGWWAYLFALCGVALAVVGHIGFVEWRTYATARFDQIEEHARSRSPDRDDVLYLTEDELDEVSELVGYGLRRADHG